MLILLTEAKLLAPSTFGRPDKLQMFSVEITGNKISIMNIKKTITILNYLAIKVETLSKMKAAKLLYYIDKGHLLKYGRLVTGDTYQHQKYGPVPSKILNIINDPETLDDANRDYMDNNISLENNRHRTIKSVSAPDLDQLSNSDQEFTDEVIEKYGHLSAPNLSNISHQEYSWRNSELYDDITIEDIAHELPKEQLKELLLFVQENKETDRFIRAFHGVSVG